MLQGAVPDVAYTEPGDGKEKIVKLNLKFISQCPSGYSPSRQVEVATSCVTVESPGEIREGT